MEILLATTHSGTQKHIDTCIECTYRYTLKVHIYNPECGETQQLPRVQTYSGASNVVQYVNYMLVSTLSIKRNNKHGSLTDCLLGELLIHISYTPSGAQTHQTPHWECPCSGGDTRHCTVPSHHLSLLYNLRALFLSPNTRKRET